MDSRSLEVLFEPAQRNENYFTHNGNLMVTGRIC